MLRVSWCVEEERHSPWRNCRATKEAAGVGN